MHFTPSVELDQVNSWPAKGRSSSPQQSMQLLKDSIAFEQGLSPPLFFQIPIEQHWSQPGESMIDWPHLQQTSWTPTRILFHGPGSFHSRWKPAKSPPDDSKAAMNNLIRNIKSVYNHIGSPTDPNSTRAAVIYISIKSPILGQNGSRDIIYIVISNFGFNNPQKT